MSSPACITISDDSLSDERESRSDDIIVISDSDDEQEVNGFSRASIPKVKVKRENSSDDEVLVSTPTKTPLRVNLDVKRLNWLKAKVDNAGLRTEKQEEPKCTTNDDEGALSFKMSLADSRVQKEWIPGRHIRAEGAGCSELKFNIKAERDLLDDCPSSSHNEIKCEKVRSPLYKLKYAGKPKRTTPKKGKQFNLDSPSKPGIFGSPSKQVTQTYLTFNSFSPKKPMTEKPDIVIDTSPHMPPMHADQSVKSCAYRDHKSASLGISEFTESQLHFLEAIRGEGFIKKYLDMISSYLSRFQKPPTDLVLNLLCSTLLKSKTHYLSSKCFWTLKRIQELHPSCLFGRTESFKKGFQREKDFQVNWNLMTAIVEQMMSGDINEPCLSVCNATKALAFLVNTMEKEVHMKQFALRQTIAFRLVSIVRAPRNAAQVVTWICTCISQEVSSRQPSSYGKTLPFSSQPYSPLILLQRMLQLSLSVSEDLGSCVDRLACELLSAYSQLQTVEARTLLLQTLQCHHLRGKLTELILQVSCQAEDIDSSDIVGGINEIITQHFMRMPPKRGDREFSAFRGSEGFLHSSEEVEEFVMLLAYSLQSYMFCHHKKLQGSAKKDVFHTEDQEEAKPEAEQHLSLLDNDTLCNMGDSVMLLHARMMSLCPYLSIRTQQLLGCLSLGNLWYPW